MNCLSRADAPCSLLADSEEKIVESHHGNLQIPQRAVSINGLLQLSPPALEAAVWQSPSAVRLLRAFDLICLANSIFVSAGLVRTFGGSMNQLMRLQAVLYGVIACVQLLAMLLMPATYQQYRFQVTLFNRLLRLVTVTQAAWGLTFSHVAANAANAAPRYQLQPGLSVMRNVVGTPVFFINHANYVLPFAYVLVAQVWTLGAVCLMVRVTVCYTMQTHQPGSLLLPQQLCQRLKVVMHYLGMMLGQSPSCVAASALQECQGVEGLALLTLYVVVLLLLVLPCLIVYFIELKLKQGFLKQHNLTLSHALPCIDSHVCKGVVVYGAVVGSWLACEALMLSLAPLKCSSEGVLVMSFD